MSEVDRQRRVKLHVSESKMRPQAIDVASTSQSVTSSTQYLAIQLRPTTGAHESCLPVLQRTNKTPT